LIQKLGDSLPVGTPVRDVNLVPVAAVGALDADRPVGAHGVLEEPLQRLRFALGELGERPAGVLFRAQPSAHEARARDANGLAIFGLTAWPDAGER
jgi:hypothetical protein